LAVQIERGVDEVDPEEAEGLLLASVIEVPEARVNDRSEDVV
jgi:hypothetical protein